MKSIWVNHAFYVNNNSVDAFVAMGGNVDKTGTVSVEKLNQVIKKFELSISVEVRNLFNY